MSFFCMSEGCQWNGTSQCVRCGERLRCPGCHCFIREDNMDTHFGSCRGVERKCGAPLDDPKGETA